MTILLAVLLGFCVDLILGDPRWMPHPVVYMGKAITRLERLLRRLLPDTPRALFWGGVVLAAVLPLGTLAFSAGVIWLAGRIHPALGFAVQVLWCWQALETVDCRVKLHMLTEENGFAVTPTILEEITPELDMLFLCEPNNPTGALTEPVLLRKILERCAACGTLLVVDECFNDWLDDPAAHTLKGELNRFPNLLILKAFTKLYAMAGLRLGYCLCGDEALLKAMARCGQPWAVSGPAQEAGLAALGEHKYVVRLRAVIQTERPWLAGQLAGLGLKVLPGSANYLLLYSEKELAIPLRKLGVLIRDCSNYPGLDKGWYRVAVRTRRENRQLIAALRKVCGCENG